MAFIAVNSTTEPRSFSIGPKKVQYMRYTAVTADVSGTITADALQRIDEIIIDGQLIMTAHPTFSGNVATLAFVDPAANRFGTIQLIGI